jgi:hypothetical protein
MIFHGHRIDRVRRVLVHSPHYHALGFCDFDDCRGCVHRLEDCLVCGGFKGRNVRGFGKDRYVVKVHGEREALFGTAFYQLNHASIITGGREFRRFHITTWWGSLAKRHFSSGHAVKPCEPVCPACKEGDHMERGFYDLPIVKDIGSPDYVPWLAADPSHFHFGDRAKPEALPFERSRRFSKGERGGGGRV